jgi:hypothetical protein
VPPLVLIGYFPKTTAIPPNYRLPDRVQEICTVSNCINAPEKWVNHWTHNELGFYSSPSAANAVIRPSPLPWSLFAYRMLPVRFAENSAEEIILPHLDVEPLDETFRSIGFDSVSKSISFCFECSPLSCNYLALEEPVNRYCLLNTLEEAIAAAMRFAADEPEPGPYYVIEVLRRENSTAR